MKNKIIYILKKNGFLIVLFICVCIVAASTIIISTRELIAKEDGNSKSKDTPIVEEESPQIEEQKKEEVDFGLEDTNLEDGASEKEEDELEGEVVREEGELVKQETNENSEVQENTVEVFKEDTDEIEFVDDYKEEIEVEEQTSIFPVEGEIINNYTKDTLVYSETLGEWRAHLGIDIKAKVGTNVKAVLDGEVKRAYKDKLWGNVIILDHRNGLETKYANLNTLEMVKEGAEVKKGDHISTVGKSADIEMLMDDHLHFEAFKDGKVVDPRSITP